MSDMWTEGQSTNQQVSLSHQNGRVAFFATLAVALMIGMAYAAVPLYEAFCRITGYGGTTQKAEAIDVHAIDRDIKVRFAANTHRDMPWTFKPTQGAQELKIGETAIAYYEAYNPTNETLTGTATFNVTPHKAGSYFAKIECFCFTEQTLKPGERVDMPVVYYVDPSIAEDPNLDEVGEITLSYTFFLRENDDTANGR